MAKRRTKKDLEAAAERRRRATMARAFAQRDELLIALSKVWEAHLMPTKAAAFVAGTDEDWLWSLCLHSPVGQLVFPLNNALAAEFGHLERDQANHWDGHTATERSKRLASLSPSLQKSS